MILTVTVNAAVDKTLTVANFQLGHRHRAAQGLVMAGGKGINVARALTFAGLDTVALLPASSSDPLVTALQASTVPFRCVPTTDAARTNIAITERDGTTTKLNEPGPVLDAATVDALTRSVLASAESASWVVLSGSLPPGVPEHWYADLVAALAPLPCRVAVDTSDGPLTALVGSLDRAAPDLIKPNAEELAGALGFSPQALEAAIAQGDPEPVVAAARSLVDSGVRAVLATLGSAGAVLVDDTGSWMATPPPIVPRSTVGAGDASLAGYLRAAVGGAVPPQCLQMAVAYGSAAAALPGSALPAPADIDLAAVHVITTDPAPITKVTP